MWFRCSDRRQFITDVGIFALALAFSSPLRLPFGANAVSCKRIHSGCGSIVIQLDVAEGSLQ
jgi:hypothetical protein